MRVQLTLNVSNLDEAVEFYSKPFNAEGPQVKTRLREFRHR